MLTLLVFAIPSFAITTQAAPRRVLLNDDNQLYLDQVAAGDFDGDGAVDLVTRHINGTRAEDYVRTFALDRPGVQNGGFAVPTSQIWTNQELVGVGDVNADGYDDVVTTGYDLFNRVVELALGGPFGLEAAASCSNLALPEVMLDDLSGDGVPELLDIDSGTMAFFDAADLLTCGVGGAWTAAPTLSLVGFGFSRFNSRPLAADIDLDGLTDLVLLTEEPQLSNHIVVLPDISGALAAGGVADLLTAGWGVYPPADTTLTTPAVGDLDGDGDPEVVVIASVPARNTDELWRWDAAPRPPGTWDSAIPERSALSSTPTYTLGMLPDRKGDGRDELITIGGWTRSAQMHTGAWPPAGGAPIAPTWAPTAITAEPGHRLEDLLLLGPDATQDGRPDAILFVNGSRRGTRPYAAAF